MSLSYREGLLEDLRTPSDIEQTKDRKRSQSVEFVRSAEKYGLGACCKRECERRIRNLSGEKWVVTTQDGSVKDVESGRSVTMAKGTQINFGKTAGKIRM